MPDTGFSTMDICRYTGIPYDTLFGWMHSGLVTPTLAKPHGRGKRARWDFRDLVAIKTVQRLRHAGVSMQALRQVVCYIKTHLDIEQPLRECWLATDGNEVWMLDGKQLLSLLRKPGQFGLLHVLDIKQTTAALQAQLVPFPGQQKASTTQAPAVQATGSRSVRAAGSGIR
jgi:MerR-like DNA binding protein